MTSVSFAARVSGAGRCGATVLLMLVTACANRSSSGATAAPAASPMVAPARQQNLITRSELAEVGSVNMLDAIRMLRPQFLRNDARTTLTPSNGGMVATHRNAIIYVDERPFSDDPNSLRNFSPSSVSEVRYLSPSEAQMKWGRGHLGGVIQLITMKRP